MNQLHFTLESKEIKYLLEADPKLNRLIKAIGPIHFSLHKNYYQSIVKQIIGQQLSLKAAATICHRLECIWPNYEAEQLKRITDEELRHVGVSRPKIKYIKDLTQKLLNGDIDLSTIDSLSDEEVLHVLTNVKGIGKWTAEMFLIFSLGRLNVLSYGDISIQNTIRWLYQIDKEEPLDLDYFYHKWKPYNSIVSLYLWEALDSGLTKQTTYYLNN